jgi:flagellar basal body-associated protein FliL
MADGNSGGGGGSVAIVAIVVIVVLAVLAGGYMMFGRGGAVSPAHSVTAAVSTPAGNFTGKANGQ